MALFLHFLNREAYRAANTAYSLPDLEHALRVLAVARSDELFTNFANILEGGILSSPLVGGLISQQQLLIEGERPSLVEFIDSRRERYAFDAARYPMYFNQSRSPPADVRPQLIRTTSLTDHIQRAILDVAAYDKSLVDIGVSPSDREIVKRALPQLVRSIDNRGDRAITRSLFAERLNKEAELSSASRLISSTYISRHQQDLNADIATGINGLAVFDHLAREPWLTNVRLLELILRTLGFSGPFALNGQFVDRYVIDLRASIEQMRFANSIRIICAALGRCFPGETFETEREAALQILLPARASTYLPLVLEPNLYERAHANAQQALSAIRNRSARFAKALEEEVMSQGRRTLLLVTATKIETQVLYEVLKELVGLVPSYATKANYIAADFGEYADFRVVHVQCEAGSVGPSGSQIVIGDAIKDFHPDAIIMGGIAFGIDRTKQALGDVLVSRMLVEYERAKIKGNTEIPRGRRIECAPRLLSILRAAEAQSFLTEAAVHFGAVLSGEKLVDSSIFVEARLEHEPEAIGGEMEGVGLAAVADREGIPWILIKAIVDWGADKQAQNTEEHQRSVARNAFLLIVRTLMRIGF